MATLSLLAVLACPPPAVEIRIDEKPVRICRERDGKVECRCLPAR